MTFTNRAKAFSSTRIARTLSSFFVALVLVVSFPGPVHAADNGNFGLGPTVQPGGEARTYFIYSLEPGSTLEDSVTLSNSTDEPMTFRLYTADARVMTDGGFALGKQSDPASGVGTWVILPADQITVPPQTEANIPFRVVVPTDATSGDHAGGIVALDSNVRAGTTEGNVSIGSQDAVGARIYVRVAGPVEPSLDVGSVSVSSDRTIGSMFGGRSEATVTYKVVNTGNVRLSPTGQVKVSGLLGLGAATLEPLQLPELLPGGSTVVTEVVPGGFPGIWTSATVVVTATDVDGAVTQSKGSASSLEVPWLILLLVVLISVAVVVRRRRASGTTESSASVGSDAPTGVSS